MKKPLIYLLIGLAIADLLAAIDVTAVNIAMPRIAELFHLGPSSVSLIQIVYTALLIIVLIPTGKVGDLHGHKRNFLLGLTLFGAASLLILFTPSFWPLLLLRALQGAGAGILYTASGALIAHHWKKTELAFGITAAFFSLGMLVGPLLGGFLTSIRLGGVEGWHWIFAVNIPFVFLSFFLVKRHAEETKKKKEQAGFDLLGLLLLVVFLLSLILLFLQGQNHLWLGLAAVASFLLFLATENSRSNPLISLSIFRNQTFSAVSLFTLTAMFSLNALSFIGTFYLQDVLRLDPLHAGLLLLPIPLGMGVFAVISGNIRNWGAGCFTASLLMIGGMVVLSTVTPAHSYWSGLFWGYLIVSAGAGFMMTNTFAAALGSVTSSFAGIASGYINTVQQLGALAGIAFAAGQNVTFSYQRLYIYLALVVTIGLVSSFFVKQRPNQ